MLLQDDRQRYAIGKLVGAAQQFAQTMKRSKKAGKEIVESDILERGLITPKEALSMLDDKVSPQEVKKVLEASGYSSKETNELVRRWMEDQTVKGLSPKEVEALAQKRKVYQEEKSLQKERQKEMKPMTKAEEEEALDKLMQEFSKGGRVQAAEGGSLLADDMARMKEQEMPTHTMPDGTVMPGATHEEGEMSMEEPEMESDSEMEDNYLDFIINEALSEEEEDMLMSKLEQDEELSMLFDKVIEVASEFAGSGPVEGPGTGVSDSIPARLSDGEFVFTAKAVEEIGADNLMAMMKEAEMKADERQEMQEGGMVEEEQIQPVTMVAEQAPVQQDIRVTKQTVGSQAGMQEEQDMVGDEIKKSMLSSRPYVRS
jgi:hypothetical protein